jgi:NAD(P)-dependent dehydrogenase (short-subunit alcohol dehydrogenase family)
MDKVVIVTGASGIGAATARLAASRGARVMVAGLDEEECRALAAETGGEWSAGDLSRECAARELAGRCMERFGRIDALFNVAGISGRRYGDGPIHECTEEGWDPTFASNVKTMFLASRAVLPHMIERRAGAILNMASVVAISPEPLHFATHAYAAGKGAAIALTLAMAAYYAPQGIRVNAIAPGLVRTPMSRRAQGDPELLHYMKTKQPLAGGLIEPEDVAHAAVFLLSDDARHITGQVIPVDAGWSVSA